MSLWYLLIVLLSAGLTGCLRLYALKQNVLDIPSARSSHQVPTPRGGGVAIVASFMLGAGWMAFEAQEPRSWLLGSLLLGGLLVAVIGFLDDHGHINARWRLLVHFVAATVLVMGTGGLPALTFFGWTFDLGWAGDLLAVVGLVWLLNLYNFMDGIDGLAGVEAITSCGIAGWLLWLTGATGLLPQLHWLLAAAAAGFLLWNFPPARIFMGDAGSGFLGLLVGALALVSSHYNPVFLWAWLILLGVFVVDATLTLLRRLLRADKVYEAHSTHAYQNAARHFGSHKRVTLAVLAINLLWLAPLASLVAFGVVDGFATLLIAYLPLLGAAWHFNAGRLAV